MLLVSWLIRHAALAQVEVPAELQRDLKASMLEAGIPVPESEERWGKAMDALKVWRLPLLSMRTPRPTPGQSGGRRRRV